MRYLGILIDEYLDWSKQAEKLKQDVGKSLYLLKRIRPFISKETALVFYQSLIQSKFDYCDVIWGNLGKVLTDRLQKIQNRALRCVLDVDWMYPSELLFTQLNVKRLEQRRNVRTLHVMYKIAHDMLPESTCNQFIFSNNNYTLRRSYFKIKLPPVKTNFKKRSLQ